VDERVLRVSKLSSFLRIAAKRSSEMDSTSFTILGSRSDDGAEGCVEEVRLKPGTIGKRDGPSDTIDDNTSAFDERVSIRIT
jgi:hypothetical protein